MSYVWFCDCVITVEDDQDEMFKPPKMEDEEYSPFGGKGGLFSGGRGLFDDDDEVGLMNIYVNPIIHRHAVWF